MGLRGVTAFATATIVLAVPATALGALARADNNAVHYYGDRGETNRVTVGVRDHVVRIKDPGALLVVGQQSCLPLSLFGTKCTPTLFFSPPVDPRALFFNLNDGNDSIVVDESLRGSGSGGAGDDSITLLRDGLISSSSGADTYVGSDVAGQWVAYDADPVGVSVSLDGVANDGAPGEGDNVQPSIDIVSGTSFADTLIGSDGGDELRGRGGTDHVEGRGGDDTVSGRRGSDVLGGDGDDLLGHSGGLDAGPPGGSSVGGEGDDTILTGQTDTPVDAGPGDDVIDARWPTGPQASSSITCGPGIDTVEADPLDVIAPDCESVTIG